MNRDAIIGILLALIVGTGVGYATANALHTHEDDDDNHTHMEESDHSSMDHGMFSVSAEEAPSVDVSVAEDTKSGWNISLSTQDFAFTPEEVNNENVIGQGHAHLYVDGEKVARLYSPYYHYDGKADENTVFKVTLNANDHSEYMVDGDVISAETGI